ncbi:MAG TPA: porin family protein [Chitinophagales bacterium]|nr:porin family protein [Chitinophagales bacterium]
MHKYYFLFLLLTATLTLSAQESEVNLDVEEADEFVEFKKDINESSDRIVIDFSYDMLLNLPDSIKTKGFSRGINVYFTYDIVLGNSRFSIAPGIGFGSNNYFMNYKISSDTAGVYFDEFDKEVKPKKSKIGLTYIDIPVELRFRSKPNKKGTSWKLAAGFKAGYMIQNKWKYKGTDFGMGKKFKQFDIEHVNKFRYGVMLRGGYGIWNLFAYYSLSDVFNNNGPKMTPLSFGISINGL